MPYLSLIKAWPSEQVQAERLEAGCVAGGGILKKYRRAPRRVYAPHVTLPDRDESRHRTVNEMVLRYDDKVLAAANLKCVPRRTRSASEPLARQGALADTVPP